MIILLSPAKIQNFKPELEFQSKELEVKSSMPVFLKEAEYLIKQMRKLKVENLAKLLSINNQLTQLNFDRIFQWQLPFNTENAKQAALVFDGEVYRGLSFNGFSELDIEFAQNHLRLMSGLYGILKPLDLIQAYRLEVSTKLANKSGNDLYKFWTPKITELLTKEIRIHNHKSILNLASSEYTKALDLKKMNTFVVSPEFYEFKSDKLKQIVIYTKRARGLMASFAIKEKISNIEDIIAFDKEGYRYDPKRSTLDKPVFIR